MSGLSHGATPLIKYLQIMYQKEMHSVAYTDEAGDQGRHLAQQLGDHLGCPRRVLTVLLSIPDSGDCRPWQVVADDPSDWVPATYGRRPTVSSWLLA